MLEIAMNTKKVQNLEVTRKDIKCTIVKNSFEVFTNPDFIVVASKIGVEIDSSYDNTVGHNLANVFHLFERQNAENSRQGRSNLHSNLASSKNNNVDEAKSLNPNSNRPEGPPNIDSLVEYPKLTNSYDGRKPHMDKPEGLPSQDDLLDHCDSPVTLARLNVVSSEHPEQSVLWSMVSKYGWGKHPRKALNQ